MLIKQLQRKKQKIKCSKLLKLQNDHTIPDSYIILPKHGRTERDAFDMVSMRMKRIPRINEHNTTRKFPNLYCISAFTKIHLYMVAITERELKLVEST